jgi:alkanesulfonate monooxygenase SsuD/methylene tetrahydromethanopterin reductase-like flavin-dependent oxidoreductase (luciferase family)
MLESYEENLANLYAKLSQRSPGAGMGLLRDVVIADTDEEARRLWVDSGGFVLNHWFEPFGFRRGLIHPETGALPTPDMAVEHGYVLVGTVDTVSRALERIRNRVPYEWLFLSVYCSLNPHKAVMNTIEKFWTKVLPRIS